MIEPALLGGVALGTLTWGVYAPNSRLFGPVIGRGPHRPTAYLTLDDGPNPGVTESILEILEQEHVPATFFMVGKYVERYPETALAVAMAGHEIGNHTYSHTKLHRLGPQRTAEEIRSTHDIIQRVTGRVAQSFRAPHGYRTPFVSRAIAPYHYRTFGWTFGVWDTTRPGAEVIRRRVRQHLRPGAILLLHDGDGYAQNGDRWQTAQALRGIIADIRSAGFDLEPLSSLGRQDG
ncbi:MAG: polysaccharide deacetylase family protein [Gemmatimonadota bacterium]